MAVEISKVYVGCAVTPVEQEEQVEQRLSVGSPGLIGDAASPLKT